MTSLKYSVRARFEDKLESCRNYNRGFVVGTKNLRVSAFKEHATTEIHKRAMLLFRKSQSSNVTQYAPIAKAISTLDPDMKGKLRRKFKIAYMLCKEGLDFTKMAAVCKKHGVVFGAVYKNNQGCATFADYIAQSQRESQREGLAEVLAKAKVFSMQADGSTDYTNTEDKLFLVLYFDAHTQDGAVHVRSKFPTLRHPEHSGDKGCLVGAFSYGSFIGWETKFVGFGCVAPV